MDRKPLETYREWINRVEQHRERVRFIQRIFVLAAILAMVTMWTIAVVSQ